MSGVIRRGSLSFDCSVNGHAGSRGSLDVNLNGGYREQKSPKTPEISVISLDFRRHSEDLRKSTATETETTTPSQRDLSHDVDSDVISNYIGHYSWWSFCWTFLLCMFQLPTTFHMFMFVFQTADKDYWCARPAHLMHVPVATWKSTIQDANGCTILDIDYSTIGYQNGSWLNMPDDLSAHNYTACNNFEYSAVDGNTTMTLVQEFNLICTRRHLLSVVEMCFLAGAAVSSVTSGWISDRFGRRHILMSFATIQSVFGGILAFSPSLAMFMTLRVIIGFASMTVTIVSFVIVVELVSGKWRTIIGILNILPVAVSYVLAAGIAYAIRDWRTLQLVISVPWMALLCMWYWLPESPRWLLARGRLDELCAIIECAAKRNGTTLPANYRKSLEAAVPNNINGGQVPEDASNASESYAKDKPPKVAEASVNDNPLMVVFSRTYWRTTCLTLVIWLTLIIIYFGLTLHLSNLGGNIYVNTAIVGTVESISICLSIFIVLRFGIRRSLIIYMLVPGICCLATNLVPAGEHNLLGVVALAMTAKCILGANNAIIPTYTAMQYPTVVRNFGVGMGNLAGGIALILVPYLWLLEHYEPLLPMSIMGVCGLVGAVAIALMKDIKEQ